MHRRGNPARPAAYVQRPKAFRRPVFEQLEDRTTPTGPFPNLLLDFGGLTPPALPSGVDVFAPPVVAPNVPAAAPDFGEWTRTAGAGQTLAITGDEFTQLTGALAGSDATFWVYAQTTSANAVLTQAVLQHLEGDDRALVTLPDSIPSNSMVLMWAENSQGIGAPIAVNQTEAWWIGPNKAQPGQTVAIFGQNLSRNGGEWKTGDVAQTPALVWIEPTTGGAGQWATVTTVNPYRVEFTVPGNLTSGMYRAWVHNRRGGAYGWSQPLTFEVRSATLNGTNWPGPVIDASGPWLVDGVLVQMIANDGLDDAPALQAALAAAKALNVPPNGPVYPTIVLPGGTFHIGAGLTIPSNVRIVGAGKDVTILRALPSASFTQDLIRGQVEANGIEIRDLTLHSGYSPLAPGANLYTGGLTSVLRFSNRVDVRLTNIRVDAKSGTGLHATGMQRFFVVNCDFHGTGNFFDRSVGVFIDDCRFWETNNAAYAILNWGGEQFSLTNSWAESESIADPTLDAGWGLRLFASQRGGRNQYLAGNTTRNLGNRPGVNANLGEHMVWENSTYIHLGTPASATSTQIVLPDLEGFSITDGYTYYAVVVDGTGIGQSRRITGYNKTTNTLTFAQPWGVPLDSTSQVAISSLFHRVVVYKNDIQGIRENVDREAYNGSAGIMLFGGTAHFVVDSNTIQDVRRPITIWSVSGNNPPYDASAPRKPIRMVQPSIFNVINKNTITYGREGITLYMSAGDPVSQNAPVGDTSPLVGNIVRRNTLTTILTSGLGIGYLRSQSDWRAAQTVDAVVFEANRTTSAQVAIDLTLSLVAAEAPANTEGPLVRSALFRNNDLYRAQAPSNAEGIRLGGGQAPLLIGNIFPGYQALYNGVSPLSLAVLAGPTASAREYVFHLFATDVFVGADLFTFEIDWTADGVYDAASPGLVSSWTAQRYYSPAEAPGSVTVRFRVAHPNGLSYVGEMTINPAERNVYYLGTQRKDVVEVAESVNKSVNLQVAVMGGREFSSSHAFTQISGSVYAWLVDGPDYLSASDLTSVGLIAYGGPASDTILGGSGADSIDGGDGPDVLYGGNGDDTLIGGNHRDTLRGGNGNDLLNGGYGSDDYVYLSVAEDSGNDVIVEPANVSFDWLDFSQFDRPVTITPTSVVARNSVNQVVLSISIAEPTAIEGILGTIYADHITGNSRANQIFAGGGYDTVYGGGGDDTIDGGEGRDVLYGGDGNDVVDGGEGDDVVYGGAGNDFVDGGEGNDWLDGGDGNDTLLGGPGYDSLYGGDGDDVLEGGAEGDLLVGGAGNDVYVFARSSSLGYLGTDVVVEDPSLSGGVDSLDFSSFSRGVDPVVVDLGAADGVVVALPNRLNLTVLSSVGGPADASGIEVVFGTNLNDYLVGNSGNNLLVGGEGNDTLEGGAGRDVLIGGSGADSLLGGGGEDLLLAGDLVYNSKNHLHALIPIKAEWDSIKPLQTRIDNLQGVVPNANRLNLNYFLDSATIVDDALADTLNGGGNPDWLLLDFLQDAIAAPDATDVLTHI